MKNVCCIRATSGLRIWTTVPRVTKLVRILKAIQQIPSLQYVTFDLTNALSFINRVLCVQASSGPKMPGSL